MNTLSKHGSEPVSRQPVTEKAHRAMRRGLFGLLLLGLAAVSGPVWSVNDPTNQWPVGYTGFAGSWPSSWTAITGLTTEAALDTPNIPPSTSYAAVLDFVGDSANPGVYWAQQGNYLFFRIRVAYAGNVTTPTCGIYSPTWTDCIWASPFKAADSNGAAGSIFLLIQPSTGGSGPQYGFVWDFQKESPYIHGMEMVRFFSSSTNWNTLRMHDVDNSQGTRVAPDFDYLGRPGVVAGPAPYEGTDAFVRTVAHVPHDTGCVTNCLGTADTTFVDFAVKCTYLGYLKNATINPTPPGLPRPLCGQTWNVQVASSNLADDTFIDFDVGGGVTNIAAAIKPTIPTNLEGQMKSATYAVLGSFGASVQGNQVVVEWDTVTEAGTVGFELERKSPLGDFERVNAELIAGQSAAGEGGSYRFADPMAWPGFTYTYRLTEVEASGNRREIGQYTVSPEAKLVTAQAARLPILPLPGEATFTPRRPNAFEQVRLRARRAERIAESKHHNRMVAHSPAGSQSLMAASSFAVNASTPTLANKAAIGVKEAGLYYVSAAQLEQTLGWPSGKGAGLIRTHQLRLSNQNKDIAWLSAANAQGLYFYGKASRSIYDPENVYVVEQGHGTLMATAPVLATGPVGAASFPSTATAEENLFSATAYAKAAEEDYWFWTHFNAAGSACLNKFSACSSREFAVQAPGATTTGSALLRVKLRGVSSLPATTDHHIAVSLNGTPIGEGQWDGLTDLDLSLPFDQTLLKEGANTVKIQALLDVGVAYNYFLLDTFKLTYQRRYQPVDDTLVATGAANQRLSVGGFSSNSIGLYDLTDTAHPKKVTGAKVQGIPGNYQLNFAPASSAAPYLILASSAVRSPASLRAMQTTGMAGRNAGVKYLVIAPEAFAESAQKLVDFRSTQSLTGEVVPLQAIYDDFGGGQKTPHAIRKFLANAAGYWTQPPQYVVLGGKGTFDPKDYLGYNTSRLPAIMALTEAGVIAADQRFVDRDGNGIGDIPIGRLPAVTASEFAAMVDKIIGYEKPVVTSSSRSVVLLADGPDFGGNYTEDSEALAQRLVQAGYPDADIRRLYLEKMPVADVHDGLLDYLQTGTQLLNYFGHSGVTGLAHQLLTTLDAASLTNKDRLPVMAGMTCYMNRFEFPSLTSLGESLLLNPAGGAAAVWSSGGYSNDYQARQLNEDFFKGLLGIKGITLGDAATKAISQQVKSGGALEAMGVYNFLGDPASRLNQ